jgi:chromosome segregation ATPase
VPPKTGVCVEHNKTVKRQPVMQNKINKLQLKYNNLENKYNQSAIQIIQNEKQCEEMADELDSLEEKIENIEDSKVKKAEQKRLKQMDKKYDTCLAKVSKEKLKNRILESTLKDIEDEIDSLKYLKGDVVRSQKLTETEIDKLIKDYDSMYGHFDEFTKEEIELIKNKLRSVEFDNDYTNPFTGKRVRDLYQQAFSRIEVARKDGYLLEPEFQL